MRYRNFISLAAAAILSAQTPAAKGVPKESLEASAARQAFQQVLDAADAGWFGRPYQSFNAVDVNGTLNLTIPASALNTKIANATQGQIKGIAAKGGKAGLKLKGTYFANSDFRTETSGDFGHILYTRIGNKGFLYSKEQNAYTTAVDLPPTDAPLTFMGWFRSVILDIKAAYVDGPAFKASLGKEETVNGTTLQTLVFNAPTGAYDAKKREQSLDETLGFWKRGRMEVVFNKATKLPHQMNYSNEAQGIRTSMSFAYDQDKKLSSVNITNQSRGMEGPGHLRVAYGKDGLMNNIAGELASKGVKWDFNLSLAWGKDRKSASIASVPPASATKKGGDEFRTFLLVGLATQVFDLQHNGVNLLAPRIVAAK